jgi:hypothetical protein
LLFNPYREFRYLTEFAGHWNVVSTINALPAGGATPDGSTPRSLSRQKYRHFQTAVAKTIFVLGEFPWQIRVGDTTTGTDYVAPPLMLSAEVDADKEVTWSLGQYVGGDEVWSSLSLPGRPPEPLGVFANQPSPFHGVSRAMWKNAALLVALAALLWIVHLVSARGKEAFAENYVFDARAAQDASLVTPVFELDGHPTAVQIETATSLNNQWMFVGYALVNDETGQAFEVARDLSYFHGIEGGESWTEGSPTDRVALPTVPAGRYFLRIETESERTAAPIQYRVRVVRDVSTSLWFMVAVGLLALPPILAWWRASKFESRRWQESDHG